MIKILHRDFGARVLSADIIEKMRYLFETGKYIKCIRVIKNLFCLTLKIRVQKRTKEKIERRMDIRLLELQEYHKKNPSFDLFGAVEALKQEKCSIGFGHAGIMLPLELPIYGSVKFPEAVVDLFLLEELKHGGFEIFMCAVAHEMAHILLFSKDHQLQYSEQATNLLAFLMGFKDFFLAGLSDGDAYLTGAQMRSAIQIINSL